MEFSRPEYWSGELFPSPGHLPNPGIEPRSPTLQDVFFYQLSHREAQGRPEGPQKTCEASEESWMQKAMYCMIPSTWNVQKRQTNRDIKLLVAKWGDTADKQER